jgi:DNA-binding LacI/PurR family transcriptional regulator
MKPTLRTVADAVGVSRSTVSNAYSRPDQLSPVLRDKIFAAARQVGYAGPNPTARSLRRGRVGAIGVLFDNQLSFAFTDPFAVRFLRGMAQAVERTDTSLLLVPLHDDEAIARRALENAAVDGFCVYCGSDGDWSLQAIRDRGLPMVATTPLTDPGPQERYVAIDDVSASRTIATHLVQLGHRRVAFISDYVIGAGWSGPVALDQPEQVTFGVTRARLIGFRDAFRDVGVPWSDISVLNAADNTRAAGAEVAAYVLDVANPPTAILACTDVLALGVLDALAARGREPGREVSVTGFDDISGAAEAGLTTIRQPAEERGRIAAELLLDPPAEPAAGRLFLPTEFVVRTSTGPVPRS